MAAARKKPAPRKPAPARKKGKKVLGVDVEAYARQLLAESGGDIHVAKHELEGALDALRNHLHAYMEVKMKAVKL
ncbi:MAG: hypothetical protein WCK73_08805 [Deltaproteobacteria bacterium]